MQRAAHSHPLGGNSSFHHHLRHTADGRQTTEQLRHIRTFLGGDQTRAALGVIGQRSRVRVDKNAIELNNAHDASLYRGVPHRVRSAALLSLGNRTKSKINSIKATKCNRWQMDSELAHSCDVLGPYACADCLRERMRKQVYDETDRTFPGLEVSERDLCTALHMRAAVSTVPEANKLPPILEAGYPPDTPLTLRGRQRYGRTPSTSSGGYHRTTYNRKLAPIPRRPNASSNNSMLPITNAELQRRVLDRQLRRELSNASSAMFTPRGIIEELTEPSMEPTPRIRVDIQIPMVTSSKESSTS